MTRRQSVLVTGARGFVGRHVCEHLLNKGFTVVGMGRQEATVNSEHSFTYEQCDLLDIAHMTALFTKYEPQYVIHLASVKSVSASWENPLKTLEINLMGTLNLLESARTAGKGSVQRVVIVGSSHDATFDGNADNDSIDAESSFTAMNQQHWPTSPYGWSKLLQTSVARLYANLLDVPAVIVRPYNLVGPGMTGGVCAELCRQLVEIEQKRRKPELVVGNIDIQRDFLDVRDAATAISSLLCGQSVHSAQVYDVCSGRASSIRSIVNILEKHALCSFTTMVDLTRIRTKEPLVIRGNNEKLQQATGWEMKYSLEDSVLDGLNEYRRRG